MRGGLRVRHASPATAGTNDLNRPSVPRLRARRASRPRAVGWLATARRLGDHVVQHVAEDVGQAVIPAAGEERQLVVVDAEQVQHGGPKVVDRRRAVDGVVAELVRAAVDGAAPAAATARWAD